MEIKNVHTSRTKGNPRPLHGPQAFRWQIDLRRLCALQCRGFSRSRGFRGVRDVTRTRQTVKCVQKTSVRTNMRPLSLDRKWCQGLREKGDVASVVVVVVLASGELAFGFACLPAYLLIF